MLLRNILNKKYTRIAFSKITKRIIGGNSNSNKKTSETWSKSVACSLDGFCDRIDAQIWKEACECSLSIEERGQEVVDALKVELGGGGCYSLLYFLTRLKKPKVIVETGVAAGYSSLAFLMAIDRNKYGALYSSDFPYIRLKDPEQYIGIIVNENLKKNWSLFTEGDKINLPRISKAVEAIDLLHYDSDKTEAGRNYALKVLKKNIKNHTIIIFDDIQDNTHFRDLVKELEPGFKWSVFEFKKKFIGLIYPKGAL